VAIELEDKRKFLERILGAVTIAKQKGAVINTPAVVAQAALESAWGTSFLAKQACNIFGVKAGKGWKGGVISLPTMEFRDGKWVREVATWRVYLSWNEAIVGYSRLIQSLSWFKDALPYADPPHGDGDPDRWIDALLPKLGEPGWATDPRYKDKIVAVAREVERLGGPKWAKPQA